MNLLKKIGTIALALTMTASLAACGSNQSNTDSSDSPAAADDTSAAGESVSGTVSTDGSTSMESVIGALGEAFMEMYSDVTFTYNPTGSGSGITAVGEGSCDIGLSSRYLRMRKRKKDLRKPSWLMTESA